MVPHVRERGHLAPVARAVRTVAIRDGLLVADAGERPHQPARVERIARVVGDDILDGRREHGVGDRVRRAGVGQLVLVLPLHPIVIGVDLFLPAVEEIERPLRDGIVPGRRRGSDLAGDIADERILVLPTPAFHLAGILETIVKRQRFVAVAHHLRIRRHDVEQRARLDGRYGDHPCRLRIRAADDDEVCDNVCLSLDDVRREYASRFLDDVRDYAVRDLFDDVRRQRKADIVVGGHLRPKREGRGRRGDVQAQIGAKAEADSRHRFLTLRIRSCQIALHARVQGDKLHLLWIKLADNRREVDCGYVAVRPRCASEDGVRGLFRIKLHDLRRGEELDALVVARRKTEVVRPVTFQPLGRGHGEGCLR